MTQLSQDPDRRLDSWKEIATFFKRNERTVRRWAADRALPVRRIPGATKGRVFAFESELRVWLATSEKQEQPSRSQGLQSAASSQAFQGSGFRTAAKWLVAFAVCATIAVLVALRLSHRFSANAMHKTESAAGKSSLVKSDTAKAEELYLQGRYYWNRRTPEDLNRAVDYFTQAIVHNPNYSRAYVGLADSYNLLREYSAMPANEAYPRALAAAKKSVELDDSSSEAHLSLAFVTYYWNWDAIGAEREFQRALALNPKDARAHHWYATYLLSCRRVPESLAQINEAQNLDPSSVAILADKGDILNVANQTEAAIVLLRQIETAEPSFTSAHRYLSEIYFARKDYPGYLREWREMATLLRDQNELAVEDAAESGFSTGGYSGMLRRMLLAQKRLNREGGVSAYSLAVTYARLGETQKSLQCLDIAYANHDSSLLFLSSESAFDALRDDPEFKDLRARVSPDFHPGPLHL